VVSDRDDFRSITLFAMDDVRSHLIIIRKFMKWWRSRHRIGKPLKRFLVWAEMPHLAEARC
jgi:hypothetical protein